MLFVLGILVPAVRASDLTYRGDIPVEFADAPAVILEEARITTIRSMHERDEEVRRKILIRRREGYRHADQMIYYDSRHSELEGFTACTIASDGTVTEVPEALIWKGVLLRDEQREILGVHFTFPAVQVGSVLEWSYTIRYKKDTAWWTRWWEIQEEIPKLESQVTYRSNRNRFQVPYVSRHTRTSLRGLCTRFALTKEERGWQREMVCRNVPAFEDEARDPPEEDTRLRVYLAFESWKKGNVTHLTGVKEGTDNKKYWTAVEDYWRSKFHRFLSGGRRAQRVVNSMPLAGLSARETIEAVREYVRSEVVMRDWERSEGLDRSHASARRIDDVLEQGSALSDEIALLTYAMLREAGLEVRILVVGDRNEGRASPRIPDPMQFEHIVLEVTDGDDRIHLDPTCTLCPTGFLGWPYRADKLNAKRVEIKQGYGAKLSDSDSRFIKQGYGAKLSDSDSRFTMIPVLPPEDNDTHQSKTISLERNGSAVIGGTMTWRGQRGLALKERWGSSTSETREKELLDWLGAVVDEVEVEYFHLDNPDEDLRVEYSYRQDEVARVVDGSLLIRPPASFSGEFRVPVQAERVQPLWIPYGYRTRCEVVYRLPEGFRVTDLPGKVVFEGPGVRYAGTWRHGGEEREIFWLSRIVVQQGTVSPDDYSHALDTSSRLIQALRSGVVAEPAPAVKDQESE